MFPKYVILYVDGKASLENFTAAEKSELVLKYTPQNIQDSAAWQSATAAQKWTYFVNNVVPPELKRRIADSGVMPLLRGLNNKLEIIENYWLLASEADKYVFMLHINWEKRFAPVKAWMDTQTGIRYWYGDTMDLALKDLWQDRANVIAKAIIKRIIKVPVAGKYMFIKDAETALGRPVTEQEVIDTFSDNPNAMKPLEVYMG